MKNQIESAKDEIAQAAQRARHEIASAAADALKAKRIEHDGDHDLIIEIKTIQQTMLTEIRELKDGTAKRISDLEACKLDIKDSYPTLYKADVEAALKDHEIRIRKNTDRIVKIMAYGTAILVFISILEPLILAYFKIKI